MRSKKSSIESSEEISESGADMAGFGGFGGSPLTDFMHNFFNFSE